MAYELQPFAAPRNDGVDVLFLAGEHSGDQHAALIARDMIKQHPDWNIAAVGGQSLRRAGAQLLYDLTKDSVVGLVEVLKHYGKFKAIFAALLDWVEEYRPRSIVMVDYPGFNLRFAEALKKRGLSCKGGGEVVVYQYVSPQIWAWKAKRRFKMADMLDELGVIFPFELECYRDTKLPVHFVGHPFAREDYQNPVRYDPDGPILLLPGSRKQAVSRIFPLMLRSLQAYRNAGGERRFVCLYPDDDIRTILEAELQHSALDTQTIHMRSVETGAEASAVLTSSGTMSLNCALAGIPGAVVYRAHPLTAWIGRRLISVEWLGIANLVLGRALYPEYLQQDARPEVLAGLLQESVSDKEAGKVFEIGARDLQKKLRQGEGTTVVERIEALID